MKNNNLEKNNSNLSEEFGMTREEMNKIVGGTTFVEESVILNSNDNNQGGINPTMYEATCTSCKSCTSKKHGIYICSLTSCKTKK